MIVARRFQFCSGHRVLEHEGSCANLHGHNYVTWVHATGDLDRLGRVIDFGVLRDLVGSWINAHWDHAFIVHSKDSECLGALHAVKNQKLFVLDGNPTAENMAKHLLSVVCPEVLTGTGVRVTKVVLYETENCFAEVSCIV